VPHAAAPIDNSVQARISRSEEFRDMKPPQQSLIAFHQPSGFLNKIQTTFLSGPSNTAGLRNLSIIFLLAASAPSPSAPRYRPQADR
jgi:hypothetical protein